MAAPKLFISYSWSNTEHEQWVVNLAIELRESGVDVILDKWDLKEGHDSVAFMEQMVTNPEITKVALICDETYATKADGRSGGVGTETQIISKEVYENQTQEKFVAIVRQKDDNGKPCLPTYYRSRIYIDLCDEDGYTENFNRLIRWIYDKPLYVKPELGKAPSFLSETDHTSLGTTHLHKRCVDAIKLSKPFAFGSFDEYCTTFAANLERFRIEDSGGEFDDAVISNIDGFIPYRNEFIQLLIVVAQYSPTSEYSRRIHRLFEDLIPYMKRPSHINQCHQWDFDNYKFIVHELFLYTLAIALKYENFSQAEVLLGQPYYVPTFSERENEPQCCYTVIHMYMQILEHRNKRLQTQRISIRADKLYERNAGTGINFQSILQADFVMFMRASLEEGQQWWPETLLYQDSDTPFEIFARSSSKAYFEKVKAVLGIKAVSDLEVLVRSFRDGTRKPPPFGHFHSINPPALLGFGKLATQP